jgi:hypothetical protein
MMRGNGLTRREREVKAVSSKMKPCVHCFQHALCVLGQFGMCFVFARSVSMKDIFGDLRFGGVSTFLDT